MELDTLMIMTRRMNRIREFLGDYCPVCNDGHLNPHPLNKELVICSLCGVELALVGEELEELNPQASNWAAVTVEVNALINARVKAEKHTLTWEVPE